MYVTISPEAAYAIAPATLPDRKTPLKSLNKGAYLYFEGDDVTHLFIIETGVVRLTRVLEDGRRQVIAFGYPGDNHRLSGSGRAPHRLRSIEQYKTLPNPAQSS